MNLVEYSDSDASDNETQPQQPVKAAIPNAVPTKAGFQKVVNRTNPHKIRVNLPTSAVTQTETGEGGDFAANDRPAKRAKTGSAFSAFNSFLPAPKNPPKSGAGSVDGVDKITLGSTHGGGLGRGMSLKTGAAPSFSREAPPAAVADYRNGDNDVEGDGDSATSASNRKAHGEESAQQEVKLVGRPMMFKPLSVARKPAKKKIIATTGGSAANSAASGSDYREEGTPAPQIIEQSKQPPPPPVKKSLFSSYNDETIPLEIPQSQAHDPGPDNTIAPSTQTPPMSTISEQPPAGTNDLQSLANNLNLTASQRRQLFGRSGVAQDARISNFNLAAEYSSNNALIENEGSAAPVAKVRGIAPGKHSLQQLVNAAANQKEALEESFATGRRNKKDAGGRYGW